MKKYTTLLFDVDNTVLDFDKDERNALKRTLIKYGIEPKEQTLARYSQINASLWRELEKGTVTKEDIKNIRFKTLLDELGLTGKYIPRKLNDCYADFLAEEGALTEGAYELFEDLYKAGYMIYFVTNGIEAIQKGRLGKSHIDKFTKGSFISEKIGYNKPFEKYFDFVFDNIEEKDKRRILLIGDSLGSDIKGALDSKIDCVWLNKKQKKNDICDDPTYEIGQLNELRSLLLRQQCTISNAVSPKKSDQAY